jgi:hypothetical protein
MLTQITNDETIELFDSIVFDTNYLKAGGTIKTIKNMPYKPYSYLMEQYVRCFRKLTIFSVGNDTVMDKLSVGVMTGLDKLYTQCYKTPALLVNNILDKLPIDTWTNPDKTFLDPFCGTGEFVVQIQKRLMAGLVMIPEKERLDYIDKNMLYFNDINNNWVEWTRFRLGGGNGFNENFREWEPEMKFDVIVGNPPFNEAPSSANTIAGTSGNTTLYKKFISKSFNCAVSDGIVALVVQRNGIKYAMDNYSVTKYCSNTSSWWQYTAGYFISINKENAQTNVDDDKIISKLYDISISKPYKSAISGSFKVLIEKNKISQTPVDGFNYGVIDIPNSSTPNIVYGYINGGSLPKGPKLMFKGLESMKSYSVVNDIAYVGSACTLFFNTIEEAEAAKLFILNNPLMKYITKQLHEKTRGMVFRYMKDFDLSQIKTGYEYPIEYELTEEEILYIEQTAK